MTFIARLRSQPRRRLVAAAATVVVLVGVATTVALLPASAPGVAEPTGSVPTTPTATLDPEPAALPTADVAASFESWAPASVEDTASTFTAEAGDAKDGGIALRVESSNPAENQTRRSLGQVVAVTPATAYTFTAAIKSTSGSAAAPNVAVIMGADGQDRYDFTEVGTAWTTQTWTYKTAVDETELPIRLTSSGPTAGAAIDDFIMTQKGATDNLLVNSSFETFAAASPQITNASLLLETGEATLGVSWRISSAAWSLSDDTGALIDQGIVDLQSGLGLVPLVGAGPGYYSIDIVNTNNADEHLQTTFAILDPVEANKPAIDARFGVGVHLSPAYVNSGLVAAGIGISTVRTDAEWKDVESAPGQYNFPEVRDAMLQDYADAGVEFLPISNYANKLYDGGVTPSSAAGIEAYAAFTDAVVSHYDSPAVEIYNEFNQTRMNKGACGLTPECYLPLLKAASEVVKSNHPETKIVGPAIARHDDAWLAGLYKAGGLEYLDAITFHPYDYTMDSGPEFIEASLQLAVDRIKENNNGQAKPIWITELGWSTAGFSEQDQADNLVRAETIALANGVEKFFWYDLVNDTANPADHEGNFGLVRQTTPTVPAFAPKPSAVAQAVLIRGIAGKPYVSTDVTENPAVHSYQFGSYSDATRVAWATTPTSVTYTTATKIARTDQFGASTVLLPKDGRVTIQLDGHPIYLNGDIKDLN